MINAIGCIALKGNIDHNIFGEHLWYQVITKINGFSIIDDFRGFIGRHQRTRVALTENGKDRQIYVKQYLPFNNDFICHQKEE